MEFGEFSEDAPVNAIQILKNWSPIRTDGCRPGVRISPILKNEGDIY